MNGLFGLKKLRPTSLLLFTALAGIAAAPAISQIRPLGLPPKPQSVANQPRTTVPPAPKATTQAPRTAPDAPVPGNPDYKPDQQAVQVVPLPPSLPPAIWDVPSALELVQYINQIGGEGLTPADYDPEGLQAAIQTGNVAAISAAATQRFNMVSSDLALGHVKKPARIDWWVVDNDLNAEKQDALLRSALAQHNLTVALNNLLPTHPQYAALKVALAETPESDVAKRNRIR